MTRESLLEALHGETKLSIKTGPQKLMFLLITARRGD